jgi:protein-tyrosine phosphatase
MTIPLVQPPNRPNSHTYWVTENVLAGEYPGGRTPEETDERLRKYLQAGITYFVDLTRPGEKVDYHDQLQLEAEKQGILVEHKRFSIPDSGIPKDTAVMKEILDTIDEALLNKHKVYIHCHGGIGRTGTVVGCFLVRQGKNGQDALDEVNRLFHTTNRNEIPRSPETPSQIEFVRNWKD